MESNTGVDHRILPARRSLLEILAQVALMLVPIVLILFTIKLGAEDTTAEFWATLVGIGEYLHGEIGWIVSLDVAIMFALFTISVGGQVLGEAMKASKMRGDLGTLGEFVAATSIIITIMLTPYYLEDPTRFVAMFGVIPAVVVVVFLGAQLGSWVFIDTAAQAREAEHQSREKQELLEELSVWSTKPWPLVIGANLLIIAIGSAATYGLRSSQENLWIMLGSDLLVVSVMLLGCMVFYYLRYTFREHIKISFGWVILVVLSVVPLVFLFFQMDAVYPGWSPWQDLPGVIFIIVGVLITAVIPVNNRSKFWVNWSIQGVVRRFARESLIKGHEVANTRAERLNQKIALQSAL